MPSPVIDTGIAPSWLPEPRPAQRGAGPHWLGVSDILLLPLLAVHYCR